MSRKQKTLGTITHVGAYQWRARIMVDGHRLSRTFLHSEDAERWLIVQADAIKSGRFAAQRLAETVTLREALARYEDEVTPHKKGATNERGTIRRMLHAMGPLADRPLSMVHTSDIAAYVKKRAKTPNQRAGRNPHGRRSDLLSASSINRELAIFSHLYNTAIAAWGLDTLRNPVTRGVRLKEPPGRSRRLEGDEEQRLIAAASEYAASPKSKVPMIEIIRFASASAMRLSEVARMEWRHVDLNRAAVLLPKTKNGRARTVALAPSTLRLIASLPRTSERVFGSSASAIGTAWKRVRDRAGLVDLRLHDLRHEAVSRLFEQTPLTESEIATISGHLSPVMLRRYTHLRVEGIVAKLAEAEAARAHPRLAGASAPVVVTSEG